MGSMKVLLDTTAGESKYGTTCPFNENENCWELNLKEMKSVIAQSNRNGDW